MANAWLLLNLPGVVFQQMCRQFLHGYFDGLFRGIVDGRTGDFELAKWTTAGGVKASSFKSRVDLKLDATEGMKFGGHVLVDGYRLSWVVPLIRSPEAGGDAQAKAMVEP